MSAKLPMSLTTVSTNPALAADLGKQWEEAGVTYILLKAGAVVASPAGKFLLWGVVSEGTTAALAGAAAARVTVACLVPTSLVGNLAVGDYFLGIRGGVAEATFAAAAVAITQVAIVAGGTVDDAVVTQPTAVGQTVLAVGAPGNARMRVILDAA
jgi:hypothetical protein